MSSTGGLVASALVVVAAAGAVRANPDLLKQANERVSAVAAAFGDSDHKPRRRDRSRGGGGGETPSSGSGRYRALYKKAAKEAPCDVSWRVLTAIGYVESRHGENTGPSSAGALGPMQFMPATWRAYGRDGDGDGRKDIHDPVDAIPAAAGYLCANGADRNLRGAIWHYNHSWAYVDKVLSTAERL